MTVSSFSPPLAPTAAGFLSQLPFEYADALERALEAGNIGAWIWDIAGVRVHWSPTLERMHGLLPGSFEGTFEEYQRDIHPEDRDHVFASIEHTIGAGGVHRLCYRIIRPDGDVRWLEAHGYLVCDPDGRPVRLVGVCGDITERKRAEVERETLLREAETARERLAVLARASQRLSESLDFDQTLQNVVRVTIPLLGDFGFFDVVEESRVRRIPYAHEDPRRQHILNGSQWQRSERADMNLCALSSGMLGLHPNIDEKWLRSVAVSPEHLAVMTDLSFGSMLTVPLRYEHELLGALTLFFCAPGRHHTDSDIAVAEEVASRAAAAVVNARLYRQAQRERERAEAASRAKDEFLAVVSHELRTPLSAILGYTSMMASGMLDADKTARAIQVIDRNARAQAELINDLLDISRIVTGKLTLATTDVELRSIIDAAVDAVRPAAEAKRVTLYCDVEDSLPVLRADPDRLQQVIWNLLNNAVKFTPKGGNVLLTCAQVDTMIRVSITDTGEGIDAAFLPFVFERFRQADSTSTRSHGGLGLGLSIVRHLVELHGGRVAAESLGPGHGASFTFELPLPDGASGVGHAYGAEPLRPALEQNRLVERLHGVRVLLLEDAEDTRVMLQMSLEFVGATVEAFARAEQALHAFQDRDFDVILSDIGLPGRDGVWFISQIRKVDGAKGRVPAVALTAFARSEDRARVLLAGFSLHLAKPAETAEVVAALASLLP